MAVMVCYKVANVCVCACVCVCVCEKKPAMLCTKGCSYSNMAGQCHITPPTATLCNDHKQGLSSGSISALIIMQKHAEKPTPSAGFSAPAHSMKVLLSELKQSLAPLYS